MRTEFFKVMKNFILSEHKEDKYFNQYIRYYETFLQNQEVLKPLLEDCEKWRLNIHFEDDKRGGYTYGKYSFYLWDFEDEGLSEEDEYSGCHPQNSPDYRYEILLTRDERHWGYCECQTDHAGYNPKYNCCGNGCDWTAPAFTLSKIYESRGNFNGVERDMWELEEKWEEHLETYNQKTRQDKLNRIEKSIERLLNEKKDLLK